MYADVDRSVVLEFYINHVTLLNFRFVIFTYEKCVHCLYQLTEHLLTIKILKQSHE